MKNGSTLKTVFKDAQLKPSSGSSDVNFEGNGVTLLKGDAELNGQKLVIGFGLDENVVSPD
jgi:hypothetical protein